jgi:hypothetical protein
MSENNRQHNGDRLPLPSPRPSTGLDQKILAYARDRAPEPVRRWPPAWTAGLATIAVVAVAILIALPPQPEQELARKADQGRAAPSAPAPVSARRYLEQQAQGLQMEAPGELSSMADSAGAPLKSRLAEAPESAPAAAAGPVRPGDEASLAAHLATIAALLQSGDAAAAGEAYSALRDRCPDCELPDSLQQALEEHGLLASP